MGLYRDVLFPFGYDFMMKSPALDACRARLLREARGRVLEIGVGTGLNLPHYGRRVSHLTALDPNRGMLERLEKRLDGLGSAWGKERVELVQGAAEAIPAPDGAFDTVVTTMTLCSLPQLASSLSEIRRVLAPKGRYLLLEHGLSPEACVIRWQHRLTGIQKLYADGCRLDVPIRQEVEAAGFIVECWEESYLEDQPRTHGWVSRGKLRR